MIAPYMRVCVPEANTVEFQCTQNWRTICLLNPLRPNHGRKWIWPLHRTAQTHNQQKTNLENVRAQVTDIMRSNPVS